ncbi:4'-phosphopantetheinyl transferase superfamily protein [Streptomyces sp. YC419]|uniref:4'-phosphopantetheinyl transferase superfamily protein n=1 Tax=Streptomyces ureilyticus TaxID=1775131 RepID=A0ABX0DV75_9ACTN|nr:4'-phosphopantetheinyl transferase superfamily protein [Streptomyces ureilyticus]
MPHLWFVSTTVSVLDHQVLDSRERAKAEGLTRDGRRREYVVAHTALRLLLGRYLRQPPAEIRLVRHGCPSCGKPHGRPAVHGDPVHFSLSHSGGGVLLAFAASPVGVDLQRVPNLKVADRVADLLTAEERQELAAHDVLTRPTAFARVWTRKEAYLKGLGMGLGRAPSLDYLGAGEAPVSPAGWCVRDVTAGSGYAAAVAVRLEEVDTI